MSAMQNLILWSPYAALPPLSLWLNIGATALVLILACGLLGAMFLVIRVMSDDSDNFKTIRGMVEAIFGNPAHLRNGQDETPASSSTQNGTPLATYREPCPGCGEEVTERDVTCPSCELRLL
ncbi:hypothetical protein [Paenibacillus paeoniae]|uniref:hypothetical protein n=1 Tax=Paenibacillus paeoniae TaxID=2292705 RepID=UPI001058AC16|nr:hypothetical protein [Paenibacillus paeoniae]